MWDAAAILFLGLTLPPGVLALAGVMTGEIPDDGGAIAAVVWLLIVAAMIGSGVGPGILEAQKAERLSRGRCSACDYDPRGDVSGVCPECGSAR